MRAMKTSGDWHRTGKFELRTRFSHTFDFAGKTVLPIFLHQQLKTLPVHEG